jgi:predicted nucleic acid-binding protein
MVCSEPQTPEALRVLSGYQNGQLSLLALELIYAEFGNIIWKKQLMQGLDAVAAEEAIEKFLRLNFRLASATTLLEEGYRIAITHKRSVYDSLYLALSLREQCQLVTADERLVNAVGGAFPQVIRLADWT